MMRIFIGIPLPNDVKFYLKETQTNLLLNKAKGNLTDINNFHMTLLFLGELQTNQLEELEVGLKEGLKDFKMFEFYLDNVGSFVKGLDQIIWIGTHQEDDMLKRLHQRIKKIVKSLELPFDDKSFKPHITLARQVRFNQSSMTHYMSMYQKPILVQKIHIYDSSRIHDQLTYTPLYTISFT
ncbi:MAG: RNA 2',3'-cyclic phosphodiesterase [Bacillota bacterium]|nr:MAG: RNA 2',3'-cyclic phosphodiesterase [Bacillota bacterium]